ncbi:MAG: FKBP-type peptidyl-prolyl cis-trans isomerase [Betaproteobacteria bacterium]|jgi:FKBP-type peptidyl-prolyl cis-trans isomerase|nr:FKBP-type peptidyl-prolyl cis-trans isomerase [Betaproteobacteria bacterium]
MFDSHRRVLLHAFALFVCAALASGAMAQSKKVEFADALPIAPPSKIVVIEQRVGTGALAQPEAYVVIDYEGFVFDPLVPGGKGLKFDSTLDRGHALSVLLGVARMIEGLDKGIDGMRVGGSRTLVIPPKFGYGSRTAFGEVPPNSTLLFEVKLLDVVLQR